MNIGLRSHMELTIEQALLSAVEAHRAGNLPDAERLYRAILQAQPNHPDANHNLGVMAVSLNKTEAALPLFKIALEANPSQGQYWLSYIDALIKEKQFDNAKNLLEQGKKVGLVGEKVDALEAKLYLSAKGSETFSENNIAAFMQEHKKVSAKKQKRKKSPPNQTNPNRTQNPYQIDLNALLEHYQNGRYDQAENLAKGITGKYPDHQFGWKVLGAVLKQTGRLQDSLIAIQRSVEISPKDANAHYNLGNTLKVLGRLEHAEASYKKAISIKPNYSEAYSNWGITLHELGRLEEAEKSYKKAISFNSNYAEAHNNLGNTLKELGRLEEAETSYKKAIAIKPEFAGAYNNLGNVLQELGKLEEATTSYEKAIAIKPKYAEAHSNLGVTLQDIGRLKDAEVSYRKAIAIEPTFAEAHFNLGNALQQLVRLKEAEASYIKVIEIKPDYAEAHSNLGITLQELGRLKEAEISFNKAIVIKPDLAEAHSNLGILLCSLGRYDEAAKILKLITFKHSQSYLLRCLYLQNEKVNFYELLDHLTSQGNLNPMIGSLTC